MLRFDRRPDEPLKPRRFLADDAADVREEAASTALLSHMLCCFGHRSQCRAAPGPLNLRSVPLVPSLLLRSRRPLSSTTAALRGLESKRKGLEMRRRDLWKMAPQAPSEALIMGSRSAAREFATARE